MAKNKRVKWGILAIILVFLLLSISITANAAENQAEKKCLDIDEDIPDGTLVIDEDIPDGTLNFTDQGDTYQK